MMKKLLIFMLVLGIVSTANATISLQIDGNSAPSTYDLPVGERVKIDVYSDGTDAWGGYIVLDDAFQVSYHPDEALDANTTYAAAGSLGNNQPYDELAWGYGYELTTATITGDISSGVQHSVEYLGVKVGDKAAVVLYDNDVGWGIGEQMGMMEITVIPEPMTVLLLGLGGLFLRRRR
jgi:hypothetical protein